MGILCASTLQPHKNLGEDDFSSGMMESEHTIDNAHLKNILEENSVSHQENAKFDDSIDETNDDEVIDEKLLEKILENVSNDDEDFHERYDEVDEVIGDTAAPEPEEQQESSINQETPKKGFLIMNAKDELFSAVKASPERKKINMKEMSPEFSQIMSEPNLGLGSIKPWKMLRVKSAQTSFFQEL